MILFEIVNAVRNISVSGLVVVLSVQQLLFLCTFCHLGCLLTSKVLGKDLNLRHLATSNFLLVLGNPHQEAIKRANCTPFSWNCGCSLPSVRTATLSGF
jgi:hypothetical protein